MGSRTLGGEGMPTESLKRLTGTLQLLSKKLIWPERLAPYGLNPSAHREWEDDTRKSFKAAKLASGEFVNLAGTLGKEVVAVDVTVNGKKLRWMKFLRIDAFGDELPCRKSRIEGDLKNKLDRLLPSSVPKQLLQLVMARVHMEVKTSGAIIDWRSIHNKALRELWDDTSVWGALEAGLQAQITDSPFKASLTALQGGWPRKYCKTDHYRQRVRDRVTVQDNFLETMPEATSIWLVDRNEKTFGFHHGSGIREAYGSEVLQRIKDDIRVYFSVEPPRLPDAHRHPFHDELLEKRPQSVKGCGFSGCAHIGHWHMTGYEEAEVSRDAITTKDSRPSTAHAEKLLRQLLRNSCGHVTRAIDLWFGVVDPEMRDRYKRVFRESSEYCGLLTTEEELACLRAFLLDVKAESHVDSKDWKQGYAWMTPFGNYTGGTLCYPQLGIQIPFPAGSISGILGRDFVHFTTDWEGDERFCIVHTTHDSVRAQVEAEETVIIDREDFHENESENDGGGRAGMKRKRRKGFDHADGGGRDNKKK